MATKVHMEALSPTMEEGQVARWLKSEGDEVKDGDVLAEIETDKATMELVARGAGVLRKRLLAEGGTAPVGTVIAVIAGADEDISGILQEAPAGGGEPTHAKPAEKKPEAAQAVAASDKTEQSQAATGVQAAVEAPRGKTPMPSTPAPQQRGARTGDGDGAGGNGEGGRIKASPLARRLAQEAGLELREVRGSGPGGRITKADIQGATSRAPGGRSAEGEGEGERGRRPAPRIGAAPEIEEVPVSQMRKTIAKRLVTSIGPVPTFYLTIDVDMTRMMRARERLNARAEEEGVKASVNDMIMKAVAEALRRHPEVNASWGENVIRRYGRVHLGVAVAIEDGLITPVIRDADRKGIFQIAREVRELAGRAREKKLQPDEYTGATFSVSNLGMFGIEEFTAIINPPEAGILAVGRVEERPVVEDGEVVVRSRMRMTMSCDHRVIDGATGARFLQTLSSFMEEPVAMLG